jgi:multiple sugar transport system substrate-binding protein
MDQKVRRMRLVLVTWMAVVVLAGCGGATTGQSGPPGADETAASGPPGADSTTVVDMSPAVTEEPLPEVGEAGVLTIWSYLAPDDPSTAAYIEAFKEQNPDTEIKYTAFPEDNYQDKVRTALQAESPPDIALIEDRSWMKAGLVEELTAKYQEWGVDPNDFNAGGIARLTTQGDIAEGIYGVGDFLGGNIVFYNKAMFDAAGIAYPATDRSMTWTEYADICRKLGKPNDDPTQTVYGCSVPDWGFGIWSKWVFGEDGTTALGNMNSPEMVEAWNLGTALVRDRYAPNANILETLPGAESDLFAQGKLGMTWSDFTESDKYKANNINFGLTPFMVLRGSESFVDTWTAPWGTFKDSRNKDLAMKFLQFIATDAQRIRVETSADPPLSNSVAKELNYGKDDPIKQQYLEVLQQAKPQVFVPALPEGAWDAAEVFRKMTAENQTDAKPLLDAEAERTQPLLEQALQQWNSLGQ